jgi:hypothetical protein
MKLCGADGRSARQVPEPGENNEYSIPAFKGTSNGSQ